MQFYNIRRNLKQGVLGGVGVGFAFPEYIYVYVSYAVKHVLLVC